MTPLEQREHQQPLSLSLSRSLSTMWVLSSATSLLLPKTLNHHHQLPSLSLLRSHSLSSLHHSSRTFASVSSSSSSDGRSKPASIPDEWGEKSDPEPEPEPTRYGMPDPKPEPEPEPEPTRYGMPDPAIKQDESVVGSDFGAIDGVPEVRRENWELKKAFVDSVYGTDIGFRASSEVRAEASELVTKLEALNPTPNPTETPALLDGNWILLYTAYSELLPLLAVGATPLLKVDKISQSIDTGSQTVDNSTTLSSPFATFSFSASASFEVRSPSRIQVQFKEATFKPPEIKSRFDLPKSVDIFGQKISLSPVQQLLNPVQEAAAGISRTLYGLPPLKLSIPGERTQSWLLTSYLDEDLRISRGDGGLFVLVREGSPLLEQ